MQWDLKIPILIEFPWTPEKDDDNIIDLWRVGPRTHMWTINK